MPDFKIFEQKYDISSYDVDLNKCARLTSILNYMQDSAWLHYSFFEKHNGLIMPENYVWLLSRIRLEVIALPVWGDRIVLQTWSPGLNRMFAQRDFIFKDKNNNTLIKASTAWLIIDTDKNLPVRPDFFKEKWDFAEKEPLIDIRKKINAYENKRSKNTVKAFYSDIDVNRHVNNAKYVEWMLDIYEPEIINDNIPGIVSIDFTGQAVLGDSVEVGIKQFSENTFYTNTVLNNNELCRMVIAWREIG